MKYIANILTDKKFSDIELCNVTDKKENLIEGIPTLCIGWEFTHSVYPEASIIKFEIDDNTFWTFGKRERRQRYEKDIILFRDEAIKRFIKNIKYSYFNTLTANVSEKKDLFSEIMNCDNLYGYIKNDMIYIFNPCNNVVHGISLRDIDYENKDRKKFISSIYSNKNITMVSIDENLSWDMKNALYNHNYVVPYLYSE